MERQLLKKWEGNSVSKTYETPVCSLGDMSRAVYNWRNPKTSYPQRNQLKLGNPMLEDEAFKEGP